MLKAILIDDETSNLSSLKEKLGRHCPQVEILACCDNAEWAIREIEALKPNLIFLDIEMPVMNGFLMLQQLNYKNFELIFTTAYDHYAIKAIKFSALDYLVKPIEVEDLKIAVQRAEERSSRMDSIHQFNLLLENMAVKPNLFSKIAIPSTEGLQFVKINDILYLEAQANYTHIYSVPAKKYIVCQTLKDFEELLPAEIFVRVHNSYIINKNFAEKYIRGEGGQVVLSNGSVIDISKRKKADFLKAFGH